MNRKTLKKMIKGSHRLVLNEDKRLISNGYWLVRIDAIDELPLIVAEIETKLGKKIPVDEMTTQDMAYVLSHGKSYKIMKEKFVIRNDGYDTIVYETTDGEEIWVDRKYVEPIEEYYQVVDVWGVDDRTPVVFISGGVFAGIVMPLYKPKQN